jgi:hypothetical protein
MAHPIYVNLERVSELGAITHTGRSFAMHDTVASVLDACWGPHAWTPAQLACGVQRSDRRVPPGQLQWATNIISPWDGAITMQALFARAGIQPQEPIRHYLVVSRLDVKTKHGVPVPPNAEAAYRAKFATEDVEHATYWLAGLYLDQQGRLRQLKKCADL